MVGQKIKAYFMTYESYMKFKFQCPQLVLLEHSHTYSFAYCLQLLLCYRVEQLQQRP